MEFRRYNGYGGMLSAARNIPVSKRWPRFGLQMGLSWMYGRTSAASRVDNDSTLRCTGRSFEPQDHIRLMQSHQRFEHIATLLFGVTYVPHQRWLLAGGVCTYNTIAYTTRLKDFSGKESVNRGYHGLDLYFAPYLSVRYHVLGQVVTKLELRVPVDDSVLHLNMQLGYAF